jgi:hypothetical protein
MQNYWSLVYSRSLLHWCTARLRVGDRGFASEAGLRSSGLGLPLGDLGDGCATASGSGLYGF